MKNRTIDKQYGVTLNNKNSLIIFAAPFATKPNAIKSVGPIIPTRVEAITINFFVPSPRLLKHMFRHFHNWNHWSNPYENVKVIFKG